MIKKQKLYFVEVKRKAAQKYWKFIGDIRQQREPETRNNNRHTLPGITFVEAKLIFLMLIC